MDKPQILLTNDDGILSPGLWAAAATLSELGYVYVVAPREQYSGAGRSLPSTSDGAIDVRQVEVNGQVWEAHAVGGTPAQAVLHGTLEVMPSLPDLVVSGINYGENLGYGITVSGTVGAALEAAAMGIPSLAVSLETDVQYHLSYSDEIDFSTAAYFTQYFGRILLGKQMLPDVHLLKLDVPITATPKTDWEITRLSPSRYFEPVRPDREKWGESARVGYRQAVDPSLDPKDTDVYVLRVEKKVSLTPLSLDMTARVDFQKLDRLLRRA
jgi:5'-nucleotidase